MTLCRRCLLYEMAGTEDIYAHVLKTKELMPLSEQTADNEYQERLSVCKECNNLLDATCLKCGCYVEIRAIKKDAHCPVKKW